jgi:hypothetical protein
MPERAALTGSEEDHPVPDVARLSPSPPTMTEAKQTYELVIGRLLAGLFALPVLAYAVRYGAGLFLEGSLSASLFLLPTPLAELTLAALLLWFALGGSSRAVRHRLGSALLWGSVVGGVGFLLGFFGPLVLQPNSNQGPLLGIFVTGPLGFVLGCIGGALISG